MDVSVRRGSTVPHSQVEEINKKVISTVVRQIKNPAVAKIG